MSCRLRITLNEVVKITIPGLKYFLKNGLNEVKDLPEKKVAEMRLALALNFQDREGFLKSMRDSGIEATRLGNLWDSGTHLSAQMAGLETAKATGMNTKVWTANGSCCKEMNGEAVAINRPFSNGQMVAHGRDGCQCSTSYKKAVADLQSDKIYTKGEIAEMTPAEYSQARGAILEQYASGKIK